MGRRKRYSTEFKRQALKRADESGITADYQTCFSGNKKAEA